MYQMGGSVVNLTTGGAPYMTVRERVKPAQQFQPEVASLNMGSMNFGLYPMLDRFKEFKHDWERQHLANSRDLIFKNTFKDIAHILESCSDNDTRFEIECYDIGHLYTAAHFLDRGLIAPPLFIQSVFGILTNQAAAPTGIKDSDAYSHFSFNRTLQDMFQLADPAVDASYLNRAKYTEAFVAANITALPEFAGSADTHFDSVRPINHAYAIPAGYKQKLNPADIGALGSGPAVTVRPSGTWKVRVSPAM